MWCITWQTGLAAETQPLHDCSQGWYVWRAPMTLASCHASAILDMWFPSHDMRWLLQLKCHLHFFSQKEAGKGWGGQTLFQSIILKVPLSEIIQVLFLRLSPVDSTVREASKWVFGWEAIFFPVAELKVLL